ncbi:unnamed protein product [Soboliphyme baturini]|uniref:Uncharacterized protein n=1 Tax=Soboliphyme baturini TaxID=241478 RepID=A0A183IG33_9BILA|nr:unnamed protein product [Soboliphyme baturini]
MVCFLRERERLEDGNDRAKQVHVQARGGRGEERARDGCHDGDGDNEVTRGEDIVHPLSSLHGSDFFADDRAADDGRRSTGHRMRAGATQISVNDDQSNMHPALITIDVYCKASHDTSKVEQSIASRYGIPGKSAVVRCAVKENSPSVTGFHFWLDSRLIQVDDKYQGNLNQLEQRTTSHRIARARCGLVFATCCAGSLDINWLMLRFTVYEDLRAYETQCDQWQNRVRAVIRLQESDQADDWT